MLLGAHESQTGCSVSRFVVSYPHSKFAAYYCVFGGAREPTAKGARNCLCDRDGGIRGGGGRGSEGRRPTNINNNLYIVRPPSRLDGPFRDRIAAQRENINLLHQHPKTEHMNRKTTEMYICMCKCAYVYVQVNEMRERSICDT